MFSDYYQVRDWLEGFVPLVWDKGELGLERIENLLKLLGNPERKFKSVHIAGTSGKGSTAFYTARLLQEAGFKVGLHISPHIVYIGERIQINGQDIKVNQLLKLIESIKPVVEKIKKENPELTPSYFEILVAAAFLYFAQEKVDWAVVEVGLGGRLDATNVLVPEVSVITNIGLDHTEILGDTVEKIAAEKAGIIKSGVPVVTGTKGSALAEIEAKARKKSIKLYKVSTLEEVVTKVLEVLKISVSKKTQTDVFVETFPGRLEEIDKGVIIDGAHNPDKVKFLIDHVDKKKKTVLVLAFKKGKDWKKMVDLLLGKLNVVGIIATKFHAVTDMGKYQAVQPKEIANYINSKWKMKAETKENSQEAVFEELVQSSLVLVTGSLYLVGEVRTMWHLPQF